MTGERAPAAPADAALPPRGLPAAAASVAVSERLRSRRILIADDEHSNVAVLHRILVRDGYEDVHATTDPDSVSNLVATLAPDLVLLDLHMPENEGFAILEQLKPSTNGPDRLPIIVLTGDMSVSARLRVLELGARDFVAKPFDITEVMLRIRNQLETRELYRALAVQNSSLEASVHERTRKLESSQLEVLNRLAAAAELRDDDTGRHTLRVGKLAARLASALDLGPVRVQLIERAAPLHDVGKIAIPDRILLKAGPLTAEEFAIMKTHAAAGARMLAGGTTELVRLAEVIAQSHHERWDGTGYPDGLAGSAIPLEARLVAVADVVDALTHDRPYRAAWTVAATEAELRRGSGTHFDPGVVAAYFASAHDVVRPDAAG